MKLSNHSNNLIAAALKEVARKYDKANEDQTFITDIHLLPKQSSGELIIFDDDEEELSRAVIEEWLDYSNEDFYCHAERLLRGILNKEKDNGLFNNLSIIAPYSFVLVDEEKETITELLIMDDDTLLVNDELLKGLDEELDEFLKELLS